MYECETSARALPRVTRRATLGGLGAMLALGRSTISFGAGSTGNNRLVILNIRGGLDGLSAVIPYGDPALAGLRSGLVPANFLKVDNFFALHPSFVNFQAMMTAGEASVVHAVGPTAATRSHFAGQDYLQSGTGQVMTSGWLSRAIALSSTPSAGLAIGAEVPLLMRGPSVNAGYAPEPFNQFPSLLSGALSSLTATDPVLGPAMAKGLSDRVLFNSILGTTTNIAGSDLVTLAKLAGSLLAAPTGPRIVSLETDSVDTHSGQMPRIGPMISSIDSALAALKSSLGAAWSSTVVLTMTEFGRTAYENGTQGTDHGTAFAVLLAGGAVNGGKVIANWPGLATANLFQQRDLAPTVDFRSIAMGVLMAQLGLSSGAQATLFPGSSGIVPMTGLVKTSAS